MTLTFAVNCPGNRNLLIYFQNKWKVFLFLLLKGFVNMEIDLLRTTFSSLTKSTHSTETFSDQVVDSICSIFTFILLKSLSSLLFLICLIVIFEASLQVELTT